MGSCGGFIHQRRVRNSYTPLTRWFFLWLYRRSCQPALKSAHENGGVSSQNKKSSFLVYEFILSSFRFAFLILRPIHTHTNSLMEDAVDVDALKARLTICRNQLESNSIINTPTRKDALRKEIDSIEMKLAQVLGIKADDEDDAEQPINHQSATSNIKNKVSKSSNIQRDTDAATPESPHRPHILSPSHTPSPSSQTGASGSSADTASLRSGEAESIRSALMDAGEGDMDLETLLREQAMMEQRLADLKRRREEEDEAFARSLQEEENQVARLPQASFQRSTQPATTTPSYSLSSSSQTNPWSLSQSKAAKSHQERMDEEMAKLLAESEDSVFDLAQSPKKALQPLSDASLPTQPTSTFSIFGKKMRTDPPSASSTVGGSSSGSSSVLSTGATFGSNRTANTVLANGVSTQTTSSQSLQNHARSILSKSLNLYHYLACDTFGYRIVDSFCNASLFGIFHLHI